MNYEIIKNSPIPKNKYPFDDMEVGDSVIITDTAFPTVRAAVSAKNKKGVGKFITRSGNYGIAIFRVK
jgi:hypothetical protein